MKISLRALSLLAILSPAFTIAFISGCNPAVPTTISAKPLPPIQPLRIEAASLPDVKFVDITRESGITFTHANGANGAKLLPETMGSGAAFFDYDGDGDPDLLLVNSDLWPKDRKGPR